MGYEPYLSSYMQRYPPFHLDSPTSTMPRDLPSSSSAYESSDRKMPVDRRSSRAETEEQSISRALHRFHRISLGRFLPNISHGVKKHRGAGSDRYCPFINLPSIIIQHVADYLPLSGQAALALTAKSLHNAIGNQSWKALGEYQRCGNNERKAWVEAPARIEFLNLMERDWAADFYRCPDCLSLHSKITLPSESDRNHKSHCKSLWVYMFDCVYVNLPWSHVHLVMQRHSRGKPYGLPLDTLSRKHSRPGQCCIIRTFTLQGKIVGDELMVKGCLNMDFTYDLPHFKICSHLRVGVHSRSLETIPADGQFESVIRCRLSHYGTFRKYCFTCPRHVRRCEWCGVEYDFQVSKALMGKQLKIQTWANLGSGQTTDDPKWTAAITRDRYVEALNQDLGSVKALYESN